jgi:hypothetical protein
LEKRWIARRDNKLDEWKPENEITELPKELIDRIKENENRIAKANKLPYRMIENAKLLPLQLNQINMLMQQFNVYKEFGNGGKIEIMEGYIPKTDHKDLLAISKYFAEKGDKVQITTDVHFKDEKYKEVFGGLIGTKYERKCPDLIINGKYYEYESFMKPFKKEKISNMLSKGLKQSSYVIINNNKGAKDEYIGRNIHNRVINEHQNIDEIWLYEKGKLRLIYKKK